MAHDIIGKLSAEVRAARLGISAFSPHREEHGLPRTGNSTVRDFLLALCDTFCATNQSSAILKWPSGWCGSLECINTGVSQPKGFTTHEVTHGPQPGTLRSTGCRCIQHVTSLFLFPTPLRTGGLTWLMRDITWGTWLGYPEISQSWVQL